MFVDGRWKQTARAWKSRGGGKGIYRADSMVLYVDPPLPTAQHCEWQARAGANHRARELQRSVGLARSTMTKDRASNPYATFCGGLLGCRARPANEIQTPTTSQFTC